MTDLVPMGLSTVIRCRICRAEQTVWGPSSMADAQGWQIDYSTFYTPSGYHFCPAHLTQSWVAWCEEGWAGTCEDLDVNAPYGLSENDVLVRLDRSCSMGHPFVGAERRSTFYPFPDVAL